MRLKIISSVKNAGKGIGTLMGSVKKSVSPIRGVLVGNGNWVVRK
jgi:hypothetical protein